MCVPTHTFTQKADEYIKEFFKKYLTEFPQAKQGSLIPLSSCDLGTEFSLRGSHSRVTLDTQVLASGNADTGGLFAFP